MKFVDSERKSDRTNICKTISHIREYRVAREELIKSNNKQNPAKKRAIYLLKRLTGKTNKAIGETFDTGRTAVSKAYSGMEKEMKESRKIKKKMECQISLFKP